MDNYYIAHHGIKGQKWGVRRFQNEDGSYTAAGKKRYSAEERAKDVKRYGLRAANRIEQRVKYGSSLDEARTRERARYEQVENVSKGVNKIKSIAAGAAGAKVGYHAARHLVDYTMEKAGFYNDFVSRGAGVLAAAGAGFLSGKVSSKIGQGKRSEMTVKALGGYNPFIR